MNAFERYTARLAGNPVDRPPNFDIMMAFAAHYIKQPLSKYYLDHRVLCDANFAMVEDFQIDILQAISDPYREAHDLGAKIEFPEDGLPVSKEHLLADESKLAGLTVVAPEKGARMSDRLEAIRVFKERSGGDTPVMGWVEGALAEAADLRGVSQLMMDLIERPEWVVELLEFCTEQAILFAKAQVAAGADMIGLGDAVASQVSPDMYAAYALPYEQRIFSAVKQAGAVPRLHICGNTSWILEHMAQSGADIIDLDWMVDLPTAAAVFGDGPVICGNMDPVGVMLQGSPETVVMSVTECLKTGGSRCISMAGCEIPVATPHANLHAQTRALMAFGK